jgi:cell wall-associated NlpC family hydrolase
MPFKRMTATLVSAFLALAATSSLAAPLADTGSSPWDISAAWAVSPTATVPTAEPSDAAPAQTNLRKLLTDFSLTLRDIRYRHGGLDPATGFDCSGFVRYVFRHSLGQDLPHSSASQYRLGAAVTRGAMKVGDLVFFRTHGKRISHVGIYLGDGRFIHSPSSGKRVSISSLDEHYWSKRFAGAKRPSVLS